MVSKYATFFDCLTGQKEQVDMAKSLVNALITKGPSGISEYYSSQTIEVRHDIYTNVVTSLSSRQLMQSIISQFVPNKSYRIFLRK